jgi:hypothetical protein
MANCLQEWSTGGMEEWGMGALARAHSTVPFQPILPLLQ